MRAVQRFLNTRAEVISADGRLFLGWVSSAQGGQISLTVPHNLGLAEGSHCQVNLRSQTGRTLLHAKVVLEGDGRLVLSVPDAIRVDPVRERASTLVSGVELILETAFGERTHRVIGVSEEAFLIEAEGWDGDTEAAEMRILTAGGLIRVRGAFAPEPLEDAALGRTLCEVRILQMSRIDRGRWHNLLSQNVRSGAA